MYKNWVKSKIPLLILIIILLTAAAGIFLIEKTKENTQYENYQQQVNAVNLMKEALEKIKTRRLEKGIPLNENLDPNLTGIIGKEITITTTTNGHLAAKRTATNPEFAALMIRYFNKIGLERGDTIAIGASGSFPSLIVATLSAAKVMELKPLLIYSLGASMYGANIPEFTFLEMLDSIQKIISYQPIAISLGGENDRADYMIFEDSKPTLMKIAKESKLPFIYEDTLAASIKKRMEIYNKKAGNQEIKAFVNVGGASANFGSITNASLSFPNGLVLNPPKMIPNQANRGLIYEYAVRGIPIIHLLNIRDLALKNGITIDPKPLPETGKGEIYNRINYNKFYISLLIALILILSWKYSKKDCS